MRRSVKRVELPAIARFIPNSDLGKRVAMREGLILETAVGMNREPREPREPREMRELKWNLPGPKPCTQRVVGGLSKNLCPFAGFVSFAVSTAEFRLMA